MEIKAAEKKSYYFERWVGFISYLGAITQFANSHIQKRKPRRNISARLLLVAEAGFEPTTFGL